MIKKQVLHTKKKNINARFKSIDIIFHYIKEFTTSLKYSLYEMYIIID